MEKPFINKIITVVDVSQLPYAERVCAAALQGLVNRREATLFLDHGVYDDPDSRRTNEVFFDDALWYGKFRELIGAPDQRNLAYYREKFGFTLKNTAGLKELISEHQGVLKGVVIWDEALPDTVNAALMLSALEDLLPLTAGLAEELSALNLPLKHDLRGRWKDRMALYRWAFDTLHDGCKPGSLACVEPGWQRPEFLDYIVQQKLFVYSLSSTDKDLGSKLLMLLTFGPPRLREFLFKTRLDGLVRGFALAWMGWKNPEVKLSNRIQKTVKALPYPTLFGWHTLRDDELAFMMQLSANGLRLVPSHLASNYSFHSQLPAEGVKITPWQGAPALDTNGVYLSFTLSDGDQLLMMNTAELGNWYNPRRGSVPFNWETQPLLAELAPALLERLISSATPNDCLIAGPSGAGYIVPPLAPRLDRYTEESARVCALSGIDVVTSYIADPPERSLKTMARHRGGIRGYLTGYAVVTRAPLRLLGDTPFVTNIVPTVSQTPMLAEDLLAVVRQEVERDAPRPRFIGVHLFAYRTTYQDVMDFVETIRDEHVHVVRADEFLHHARQHLRTVQV